MEDKPQILVALLLRSAWEAARASRRDRNSALITDQRDPMGQSVKV